MAADRSMRGVFAAGLLALSVGAHAEPVFIDQGAAWTQDAREVFYTTDQGSRLIPYDWLRALRSSDGTGFLADGLARYGYLANSQSKTPDLPVGFVVGLDDAWGPTVGMNCAACHTRQIAAKGQTYRIDGGPALANFQALLSDLDSSVTAVLASAQAFAPFAAAVLGPDADPSQVAALEDNVRAWDVPFNAIISRSLKDVSWGNGRLDAVSMIFNRVAGLDIGLTADGIIRDNIQPAVAPVRYPFLWNASKQDTTQWPGFSPNGSAIFALGRNTGEVLGVFAKFHPRPGLIGMNFQRGNSVDLGGLWVLETRIMRIGAPVYPGPIDRDLAARGKSIFEAPEAQNGCGTCHQQAPGLPRPPALETWRTPLQDVGTDSREWSVVTRTVDPGVLAGELVPLTRKRLGKPAPAIDVLQTSVFGTIAQRALTLVRPGADLATILPDLNPASLRSASLAGLLEGAFVLPVQTAEQKFPYESRVLHGVWAAAPYLHNGSVPTLADLLVPDAQRPATFNVGPEYDLDRLGLAAEQNAGSVYRTTDCTARDSGNSRCGHNFGTGLSPEDKRALLEYLKML